MSNKRFKKTAIHSGIGDRLDLLVKQPEKESVIESFKVAARARGSKRNQAEVYPKVEFQYGVHYKGKTQETYNEEPFGVEIPAYPKRQLEYDIEERRYLCYDRFWEIQADFEATVMRMIMEYAFEYKIKYRTEIPAEARYKLCWSANGMSGVPLEYALKWKGSYPYSEKTNAYEWLTSASDEAKHLGPPTTNYGRWERGTANGNPSNTGHWLIDITNKGFWSGVAAKNYVNESRYVASLVFKPLYTEPTVNGPNTATTRFRKYGSAAQEASPGSAASGYDDDVIGVVFKYKNADDYYVLLIEGERRTYGSNATRSPKNLEGFDTLKKEREVSQFEGEAHGTVAEWPPWVARGARSFYNSSIAANDLQDRTKGWGLCHQRIYRVINGKLYRVDTTDGNASGTHRRTECKYKEKETIDGKVHAHGWKMLEEHKLIIESFKGQNTSDPNHKRVKIFLQFEAWSEPKLIYDFQTENQNGSVGLINISQAVGIKDFKIEFLEDIEGRRPIVTTEYEKEESSQWQNKGRIKDWLEVSIRKELQAAGYDPEKWNSTIIGDNITKDIKSGTGTWANVQVGTGNLASNPLKVRSNMEQIDGEEAEKICIPENSWYTTFDVNGVDVNAKALIQATPAYQEQVEGMYNVSLNVDVKFDPTAPGDVVTPYDNSTGKVKIKARLQTVEETKSGRYPDNGWLSTDHIGDITVADNAESFIRENATLPTFTYEGATWENVTIEEIIGIVKPDPNAAYDLPWSPKAANITGWFDNPISPDGPIIAHSNNPSDADKVYTATYYKCGFATICPDNLSKATGVIPVQNTDDLFAAEILQFFNRNTYINKKKKYTLLYPTYTEPLPGGTPGVDAVVSLGGCILEEGKDPETGEPVDCRPEKDDFFFDGVTLIMWTCKPPVVYTTKSYNYGIYAFEGQIKRMHHTDFDVPNPWTTYRLIPIVETIEEPYDYVKWMGTEELEWLPPYAAVRLRTTRYFIPDWSGPYEGKNTGVVTTKNEIIVDIPPIPEYYVDPVTRTEMPYGYSNFVFLLESDIAFDAATNVDAWWMSDPSKTAKTVDTSASNVNQMNGKYMLKARNMSDRVVIRCYPKKILTEWVSGKYIGYGKLNGQEPLRCDGAGKADMINVPTDVIAFPSNLVAGSLVGPFVEIQIDEERYPGIDIKKVLNEDGTVSFSTDYKDIETWYTDWVSPWVQLADEYQVATDEIVSLGTMDDLSIEIAPEEQNDVSLSKLEMTSNNPYVMSWAKALTKDQLKELSNNIDSISMTEIKNTWAVMDTDTEPTIGKGDWEFMTREGEEMLVNKRNQNGRSIWYNPAHSELTDYGFRMKMKVDTHNDQDMIGVVFRYDPVTKNHYAVEWDGGIGGTEAKGLRLVRYKRNASDSGYNPPTILAKEEGFYWGAAQKLNHNIMVKVRGKSIKVYINNILKFNVVDTSPDALTEGAWGPCNLSQEMACYWNFQQFVSQNSPEIFAKIREGKQMPWSPMIHNGHFYFEDKENFLYARAVTHEVTPTINHELFVSPRPEQAAPIIVMDRYGNNLRKVSFYDNGVQTLENTERFKGNGNSAYYLTYKGIDKDTVKVQVNGEDIEHIFYDDKSKVEFMRKLTNNDTIVVKYKVLYSFMVDMNYDVENNRAKITLHSKYNPADMRGMSVSYEAASDTPFYRAKEVKFNPLLNHNHAGFLYLTDENQVVKDVQLNVSPKTLEASKDRKILLTAKVLDEYGNPVIGKSIQLYRNQNLVNISSYTNTTNEAGEVYIYYTPINNLSDLPQTRIDEYKVVCDGKEAMTLLNYYEPNNMNRTYLDIELSKQMIVGGTTDRVDVEITLRDRRFIGLANKAVKLEVIRTNGTRTTTTEQTSANGKIVVSLSGVGESQGHIYLKATHDMGVEDTTQLKSIKVLGG